MTPNRKKALTQEVRTVNSNGVEWHYWPNRCYTGTYKGIEITIRRMGAAAKNGIRWRLFIANNIAMGRQFHTTADSAQKTGKTMVEEILASPDRRFKRGDGS